MVESILQTGSYDLAQKLLDAAALRQEAIASNLANAETPGYHRLDVAPDFYQQLKASVQSGDAAGAVQIQPKLAEDHQARSVRPDGNTVDLQHELLAMDQNSVEYGYLLDVVSNNLKQLKIAITGQPS